VDCQYNHGIRHFTSSKIRNSWKSYGRFWEKNGHKTRYVSYAELKNFAYRLNNSKKEEYIATKLKRIRKV
jgi:hypothetical protein